MADIVLAGLRKVFANGQVAVAGLDLAVADGERLALVGPSGSGKSTILRLIAGLEQPTEGRILVGGKDVTNLPPEARDLTMVFQSYALYPHMTVRANLGFGLRMRGVASDSIQARVRATAESLAITDLLDRLPAQLSGGQRQRVALGRAIVRDPKAFLFDEPLSNLDPRLRGDVRAELVRLHGRLRATMVYVTHDQEEAMTLGQRIAVLRKGVLEQVGTPEEVYTRPANIFVAGFIGSPPMNLLTGRLAVRDGAVWIEWPDGALPLGTTAGFEAGSQVTVGIRPHDVALAPPTTDHRAGLVGCVDLVEPLGHVKIVHLTIGTGTRLVALAPAGARIAPDEFAEVQFRQDRLHLFGPDGLPSGVDSR